VRDLFDDVVLPFLERHPRLGLPRGEAAWAPYRWATAAVSSYSFILGDHKFHGMVPVSSLDRPPFA
jgi:SET domain-containing protein 6